MPDSSRPDLPIHGLYDAVAQAFLIGGVDGIGHLCCRPAEHVVTARGFGDVPALSDSLLQQVPRRHQLVPRPLSQNLDRLVDHKRQPVEARDVVLVVRHRVEGDVRDELG
jgi:hypothetical protein